MKNGVVTAAHTRKSVEGLNQEVSSVLEGNPILLVEVCVSHVCTHKHTRAHAHTNIPSYTRIHKHADTQTHSCTQNTLLHVDTQTYSCMCTHEHTFMHTHACSHHVTFFPKATPPDGHVAPVQDLLGSASIGTQTPPFSVGGPVAALPSSSASSLPSPSSPSTTACTHIATSTDAIHSGQLAPQAGEVGIFLESGCLEFKKEPLVLCTEVVLSKGLIYKATYLYNQDTFTCYAVGGVHFTGGILHCCLLQVVMVPRWRVQPRTSTLLPQNPPLPGSPLTGLRGVPLRWRQGEETCPKETCPKETLSKYNGTSL